MHDVIEKMADACSGFGDDARVDKKQIIRALKAADAEGWCMVPMEITRNMHIAAHDGYDIAEKEYPERGTPINEAWEAALASRPKLWED